jgi:hypothetical protein
LGLTNGFWAGQRIEESFNLPYLSRAYANYRKQQMHLASIDYNWLQKKKIELYTGLNLGAYSLIPVFGASQLGETGLDYISWNKNRTRSFRGAFGAQSGIIIGKKKLRTKIELRHAFFTQYEFAGFAQEMNTSLSIGVLWLMF